MIKFLKIAGLALVLILVLIQFFPAGKNKSDEIPSTDFMMTFHVPEKLQQTLHVSCYDCHSNDTHYPWYNKIQPVAWYLGCHIRKGKSELNFSEFGSYSKRRQKSKITAIINQIRDNEMPLPSYKLIHRDARLSAEDKKMLVDFMETLKKND